MYNLNGKTKAVHDVEQNFCTQAGFTRSRKWKKQLGLN